jgi:hypothetical protein
MKLPFLSVVPNCTSEESELSGVTDTVASLKSCLPELSVILPFTDPEIFALIFPLFFWERTEKPVINKKKKQRKLLKSGNVDQYY